MSSSASKTSTNTIIDSLSKTRLEKMNAAALEIEECLRALKKADLNIVGELIKNQGTFYELEHYPKGDVYDKEHASQYYYHAHRGIAGEHGHFHTFARAEGIPAGIEPVPYDGKQKWPEGDDLVSHLVAVSMDVYGFPIGLFTTNRWVTDEAWYQSTDVVAMLDNFTVDHAYPSWPVNRWLSAMFILFRPDMAQLLHERDQVVAEWQQKHAEKDVFEDRKLEVTSSKRVSVKARTVEIKQALGLAT